MPQQRTQQQDDDDRTMGYVTDPIGVIILNAVAAGVILSQAAIICDENEENNIEPACEDELGFAVSVGIIALVLDLIYLLMVYCGKMSGFITVIFSAFVFVMWIIAVGVLTFRAPFTGRNNVTDGVAYLNGYFASWVGFFTAAILLKLAFAQARYAAAVANGSGYLGLCLLSSGIVLAQAATNCDYPSPGLCDSEADIVPYIEYAIALSVVSLIICTLLFFASKLPGAASGILTIFLGLWNLVGAIICTFEDPFTGFGNGYFGVWGMAVSAMLMLNTARAARNTV